MKKPTPVVVLQVWPSIRRTALAVVTSRTRSTLSLSAVMISLGPRTAQAIQQLISPIEGAELKQLRNRMEPGFFAPLTGTAQGKYLVLARTRRRS